MSLLPSILAADPANIAAEIRSLGDIPATIHFDIGDGGFVPSMMLDRAHLGDIPSGYSVDVHLMVEHPSQYLETCLADARVTDIAFHVECGEDIHELIQHIRQAGRRVGLAILAGTSADHLDPYLLEVDYVLVMTVKGGFSGTPFLPEVLPKIARIHAQRPELPIIVDGGINLMTLPLCVGAGATSAVVGSCLFGAPDRPSMLLELGRLLSPR